MSHTSHKLVKMLVSFRIGIIICEEPRAFDAMDLYSESIWFWYCSGF